ncbi:TrkH family potassium uptake protein [Catelliglobosispora koreensis]|uniref:TrkH family potassium uptake protein n=1 Tax=Catelliglobosispora koreensis TaxID=129052 RepID=UPI000362F11E|nr:potassium transporter TrkG [Catelliglobosispora koreensis]
MWSHPSRALVGGFAAAIAVGTLLLWLPVSVESGESPHLVDALFTSASAVCVTGLVTVDTASHWSTFGEVVIMGLIQVGGLGIMSLATLLALLISGRLGLQGRLLAQAETKTMRPADVRRVLRRVLAFTAATEAVVAVVLAGRFWLGYDMPFGLAVYRGVFHAISAFNNAGFALWPDSLIGFQNDAWILVTIALAVILGGLGFPVVFELARQWRRPSRWTVLTRITVIVTTCLLTFGFIVITAAEWNNPGTLAASGGTGDRLLNGMFAAVMPRTAGFNAIDIAALTPESLLAHNMLMFIGGGSASTAGGIKVTTFGLLAYVIWAELRGEPDVGVGRRAVPADLQRQALAIALIGVGAVAVASLALVSMTHHAVDKVVFEAISAFGTVGLSTGITADMPRAAHVLLAILMFAGRVGPLTLGTALALRQRARRFQLPEERSIVG